MNGFEPKQIYTMMLNCYFENDNDSTIVEIYNYFEKFIPIEFIQNYVEKNS